MQTSAAVSMYQPQNLSLNSRFATPATSLSGTTPMRSKEILPCPVPKQQDQGTTARSRWQVRSHVRLGSRAGRASVDSLLGELATTQAEDTGFVQSPDKQFLAERIVARAGSYSFRPRARLLQLLGDELIGSDRLAVFELVKNAYDADATNARVLLDIGPGHPPKISVTDDGEGMSYDVIRSVWLSPGQDNRKQQRLARQRTPEHRRLPLGEKGVGRFAVHKLGNRIRLITRRDGCDECVVEIDWAELIEKPYLDEAPVTIQQRRAEVFTGDRTGTTIEIGELRTQVWRRGEVRRLHSQITSICSPFEEPDGFEVELDVPGCEHWLADLPSAADILERAIWKFSFRIDAGRFDWEYEFREVPGLPLGGRTVQKRGDEVQLPKLRAGSAPKSDLVAKEPLFAGIGPVRGAFYVYDRDRELRKLITQSRSVEEFLDESGGVRVYRDGIRVYNYGERGDDWLGLDLRRVNLPTRRISRNIIVGAIHLSLQGSSQLVEKTNREGFVDNEAYRNLHDIVLGVIGTLEDQRHRDKDRIRQLSGPAGDRVAAKIDNPLRALKRAIRRDGMQEKLGKHVDRIERNYREMQETLLSAATSGLNLAVVFHEVERNLRELDKVVSAGVDRDTAARLAKHSLDLLDGFGALLRRHTKREQTGRKLIEAALRYNAMRFRHHQVAVECPLLDGEEEGFRANFAFGMMVGVLGNLIDNALYWTRLRWPDAPGPGRDPDRKLYIGVSRDLGSGPAIVVADNGVGFRGDDPGQLARPFFTRKPDGMGLGLHYATLVMEAHEGQLAFPQPGHAQVPGAYDGAIIAMVFKDLS